MPGTTPVASKSLPGAAWWGMTGITWMTVVGMEDNVAGKAVNVVGERGKSVSGVGVVVGGSRPSLVIPFSWVVSGHPTVGLRSSVAAVESGSRPWLGSSFVESRSGGRSSVTRAESRSHPC